MKICWNNIENLHLTKSGIFRSNVGLKFRYVEKCSVCGNPYLAHYSSKGTTCSRSCASNGTNNGFYGKSHSKEFKLKMSEVASENIGNKNPNFKGGYWVKNLPLYSIYFEDLSVVEKVRQNVEDTNILEVKCAYCGKWFIPTRQSVDDRLKIIRGSSARGENRFYCSDGCKNACPIFNRVKYPKGFKKVTSREVQPELR